MTPVSWFVCRETNLKFRQAPTITHNELTSGPVEQLLQVFDGQMISHYGWMKQMHY